MFLPSMAFASIEKWTYVDSFYFTFITLSTIGFGDYIAGYNGKPEDLLESDIYKTLIVVWIMVALGYWILLLNFLQKAVKSNAKMLKKTFKGKNITKQAEFLKQLMAKMNPSLFFYGPKVKQQQQQNETPGNSNERLHMMAMMVESLTSSTCSGSRLHRSNSRSASLGSCKPTLSRLSSIQSSQYPLEKEQCTVQINIEDIKSPIEIEKPIPKPINISFNDLMKINVALKTDTLVGFESLVSENGNLLDSFSSKITPRNNNEINRKVSNSEVTLPIRDVIGVVLLVASMEEECRQEAEICEDEGMEEADSEMSNPSSMPIIDPRESVPLLKSLFFNQNEDNSVPMQNTLPHHERETIKNAYFESALNHYLEECQDDDATDNDFDELSDDECLKRRKSDLFV